MTTQEDFTIMLDAFGRDATAYPGDGSASSLIRAVVDTGFANQEEHPQTGLAFATATITVSADDWPSPDYRDQFNFGGHTWRMAPDGWEKSTLNENSTSVYKGHLERDLQ